MTQIIFQSYTYFDIMVGDSMDGCYIIKNAYRFTVPKTQQILENRSNLPQRLVFTKSMTVKIEEFNGLF